MKRSLQILVLIFLVFSCNDESKLLQFETTSLDKDFEADISITYDSALGKDKLSKIINTNIEKAILKNVSSNDNAEHLKDVANTFNKEYLDFKTQFEEAAEPTWELHIETEKTYQSEDVITIAISTYEFKGGAHGNDAISFLNLNAKTGQTFEFKDNIKDIEAFKSVAKAHFIKSLEAEYKNGKMEDFFFGKPFQLAENIGYTEDGIVLLYNIYEIASYDRGYTEFVIPFAELDGILILN